MLVSHGVTPIWGLHTWLCRFVQNISSNISRIITIIIVIIIIIIIIIIVIIIIIYNNNNNNKIFI